ncbi:MAG: hypothetical protein HRJ53_04920 [Acidobacteria bacterium Pan2503]|uniref:Uncharacterized protein n=1 Tax=Candidatus Acidiferrum panamense TaxID=2741543 RepID=A0A7V8NN11_9BACT|nr:hypothetical protein [Candidatus Acidoferrum panamensis]
MTTFSTNTTLDQSSNVNFQTWVNLVYNALVTQCGLTQTGDTGQMAVPCVTAAPNAGSQSAGFYIFRFNDTLQATLPIFFKLEFGSGAGGANYPGMAVTLGTGSNGSGTITSAGYSVQSGATGMSTTPRLPCGWGGSVQGQTTTNFPSRFCYNTTQGFCGVAMQIGQGGTANVGPMGFFIFRNVNATGAPVATGFQCVANFYNTAGPTQGGSSTGGYATIFNATTNTVFGSSGGATNPGVNAAGYNYWMNIPPYSVSGTIMNAGTAGQIFPVYQMDPAATTGPPNIGITNAMAIGCINDLAVNSTVTTTILGSTSLTYIQVGVPFGYTSLGAYSSQNLNIGILMLWQ